MEEKKKLLYRIEELGLSYRSYNALKQNNLLLIKDLLYLSEIDLKKIKNLGEKSISEILNKISFLKEINKNSRKKFINKDGKTYYDLLVKNMDLSIRIKNCLEIENIKYLSELINLDIDRLRKIKNLGEKSINDILEIKNTIILEEVIEEKNIIEVPKKIPEILSNIFNLFFLKIEKENIANTFEISNEILKFLKENNIDLLDLELSQITNDNILNKLSLNSTIKLVLKKIILNTLEKYNYGCNIFILENNMPFPFNKKINDIVLELLSEEIIIFFEDNYIINYPSCEMLLKKENILNNTEQKILSLRRKGQTLEEIGQQLEKTRERIRQIEVKILKKIKFFLEDKNYKEKVYEKILSEYNISKNDFIEIFKESEETYNLYALLYREKKEKTIEDMQRENLPLKLKKRIEKFLNKDYLIIGGEKILYRKFDLIEYVCKNYATSEITFDEFQQLYLFVIEDINKTGDEKLKVLDRGFENRLSVSEFVLWKYKRKFRYYNIKSYDFTELLETLNLNQYENIEYSTLKFFNTFPELMKEYDIRDEYELHNLLKKICKKEDYPNLNFARMPHLDFGKVDVENQILDFLIRLAPIKLSDFAQEYENEYGIRKETLLGGYMKNFNSFYHNGILKIDFPVFSPKKILELKNILNEDFYFFDEVKKIFVEKFPGEDTKYINPYSLKDLGFKVYSSYVLNDKYISLKNYILYLLTKDNIIDLNKISNRLQNLLSFSVELQKLKNKYELIEFTDKIYINIKKLNTIGITINNIRNYIEEVINFIEDSKYFTIFSLKKRGFSHELELLGFEDYFYSSILAEEKEKISYLKINKHKLFLKGNFKIELIDFIENIVYSQENLSIDIYELIEFIYEEYSLKIKYTKILEAIKNSMMYYSNTTEKIYADYNIYYEEIGI